VGAAVRSRSGKIYAGANLENASSGLSICAEAAALTRANSAGDLEIETIAVVGFSFPDPDGASRVVTPCGSCRQLIAEAAQLANSDVRVLCCSGELDNVVVSRISELLPNAFGPENLEAKQQWPTLRGQLRARAAELTAIRKKL
jgi:cytidine deaminase